MKELIIIALLFWFGGACFAKIIFLSIQRGQWLDKLLNWQNRLRNWDISGTSKGFLLSKIGGYCELCFSHLVAFLNFWALLIFTLIKSSWITENTNGLGQIIFLNIISYLIFVCGGTIINLWFILNLFSKKK